MCLATMTLLLLVLSGCKGKEPASPSNDFHTEEGMYVGITGFGEDVSFYKGVSERYNILSESTLSDFTGFVNNLDMTDATVLYYAVDNNLDYLTKCQFPNDLSSVNIVTFTDGLNQGSRALDRQDGNHDYASNDNDYVNAVNNKLKTITVQGHSINAYAIGIRGKDVQGDAVATFKDNLVKLSSSSDNATEVSSMDEVNAKFKEIANSLYKQSSSSSMCIVIPMPSDGESERFTFDYVSDASESKCYLEGVYAGEALSNVVYVGCSSTAGNRVVETSAGGVRISFEFPSLVDDKGNAISAMNMQQWHKSNGSSTWVRNSEFRPQESTTINVERKSAVVMLILDCSSSLGNDFAKMKESAKEFLKILAVGGGGGSNSGGNMYSGSVKDVCGNTYNCVKIGSVYWTAENMRCNKYDTQSERAGATISTSSSTTYAPYYTDGRNATTLNSGNLTSEQRNKLGYLYNWAAAVGIATAEDAEAQTSEFSTNRQGICPNGWHVPTRAEWETLGVALGGTEEWSGNFPNVGKLLKTTSGWYNGGNGTDDYSFAALPAGCAYGSTVINVGTSAHFWTATPGSSDIAYFRGLYYEDDDLNSDDNTKSYARSVRCVRN